MASAGFSRSGGSRTFGIFTSTALSSFSNRFFARGFLRILWYSLVIFFGLFRSARAGRNCGLLPAGRDEATSGEFRLGQVLHMGHPFRMLNPPGLESYDRATGSFKKRFDDEWTVWEFFHQSNVELNDILRLMLFACFGQNFFFGIIRVLVLQPFLGLSNVLPVDISHANAPLYAIDLAETEGY